MLDAETLRKTFSYDPETGHFYWLKRRNGVIKGRPAGYVSPDGYITIRINRILYKAHRLAWLYIHGIWPSDLIDHINNDPSDNRLSNLREATHSQNLANVPNWGKNTSGLKGVSWCSHRKKWKAQVRLNNKRKTVGLFDTKEEAFIAYCKAASEMHGEFFNPGT
jgi:hypothetical protein